MDSKCRDHNSYYIDTFFGKKGGGLWVAVIGAAAILYQVTVIINILELKLSALSDLPLAIIYFFVLVVLVLFFMLACIAVYEGSVTVQRVKINDDMLCTVWFYYGKKLSFSVSEVEIIVPTKKRFLKSIRTPLGRGGENYKIQLKNGRSFFVSGAMPDKASYINWLTEGSNASQALR
jgi:hypothetical protein